MRQGADHKGSRLHDQLVAKADRLERSFDAGDLLKKF